MCIRDSLYVARLLNRTKIFSSWYFSLQTFFKSMKRLLLMLSHHLLPWVFIYFSDILAHSLAGFVQLLPLKFSSIWFNNNWLSSSWFYLDFLLFSSISVHCSSYLLVCSSFKLYIKPLFLPSNILLVNFLLQSSCTSWSFSWEPTIHSTIMSLAKYCLQKFWMSHLRTNARYCNTIASVCSLHVGVLLFAHRRNYRFHLFTLQFTVVNVLTQL